MPNVVVVAGGKWQEPIVRYLKSFYKVSVINPVQTPTTDLGEHICADIKTVDISLLGNPKFITSDQSDVAVMPVAKLSKALGTRANSIESITLFTDKLAMADHARKLGISIPITSEELLPFPCIMKPVDANASRGFVKLDTFPTKEQLEYTKSFSVRTVFQEYIVGEVYVLDGFCSGGNHKTLACASKTHFRDGVASSVDYSVIPPKGMIEANDAYVESSGLEFGITHAEYMVNDKFFFLEIAARGGGFAISSTLVPWVTGVNLYDLLHRCLLGETIDVKSIEPLQRAASLQFYEFSGEIKEIRGIPNMQLRIGDIAKPARDGSSRHAFDIALGETRQEVQEKLREIYR